MTTTKPARLFFVALLWMFGANHAFAQEAPENTEFSEAEVRLWMTDQLSSVADPVELTYTFERSGTLDAGFKDTVTFTIDQINDDGTKAASLKFFTGERNFPVPPVVGTDVNPIFKVYLQGDVYEMNRLSDPEGASRERWRYFQRRIKFALAEGASVQPVAFEFDGKQWSGQEISFTPYTNDPKRNLFEAYADKSYSFIISDELPGYLYRIETVIPGADGKAPLVREVLQLTGMRALTQ